MMMVKHFRSSSETEEDDCVPLMISNLLMSAFPVDSPELECTHSQTFRGDA